MSRWIFAITIAILAVLMLLPAITAAGKHLKDYFGKTVHTIEHDEHEDV